MGATAIAVGLMAAALCYLSAAEYTGRGSAAAVVRYQGRAVLTAFAVGVVGAAMTAVAHTIG